MLFHTWHWNFYLVMLSLPRQALSTYVEYVPKCSFLMTLYLPLFPQSLYYFLHIFSYVHNIFKYYTKVQRTIKFYVSICVTSIPTIFNLGQVHIINVFPFSNNFKPKPSRHPTGCVHVYIGVCIYPRRPGVDIHWMPSSKALHLNLFVCLVGLLGWFVWLVCLFGWFVWVLVPPNLFR